MARSVLIAMILATLCTAILAMAPSAQTINGIRPIFDPTPNFAKAHLKQAVESPSILQKPDPFTTAFFMSKAKILASLTNTKYTAAQMGICGTVISLYDTSLGGAIKTSADRISKGTKDFDTLTKEEVSAIQKASGNSSLFIVGKPQTSKEELWLFFSGSYLGVLAAYVTVWHISPNQATLLQWIGESVKVCADQGIKLEASSNRSLADSLKNFTRFVGKTLDEATMKELGSQLEDTLRVATPEKYRW